MISRETETAFYRPEIRRLVDLTNEELQMLFELRVSKIKIDPKGFWDDNKTIYWNQMFEPLMKLYEVLLEIQARYPKKEICEYGHEGPYFDKLIPLNEKQYIDIVLYLMDKSNKKQHKNLVNTRLLERK